MRAIVYHTYGSPDVLELQEVAKPDPKEHEILIQVHAASVTPADIAFRKGEQFLGRVFTGLIRPSRILGVADVTGVCSATNAAQVKSLGADTVIDYTKEDFTTNGQAYDIIFDAVGKRSFSRCKGSLTPTGIYLTTVPTLAILLQTMWTAKLGSKKAIFTTAGLKQRPANLLFLSELVEAGKLHAVIDRRYPLEHVAEAHRYVESGHKKGNVVITLAPESEPESELQAMEGNRA